MIKKAVKEVERAQRVNRMQKNRALEMHREHKGDIREETIYDKTRRCSLLFEARVGVLRTKLY